MNIDDIGEYSGTNALKAMAEARRYSKKSLIALFTSGNLEITNV
jgi:hypothetical protein